MNVKRSVKNTILVFALGVNLAAAATPKTYSAAAVKAAPDLSCQLSAPGKSAADKTTNEATVYTDSDGFARFYAVKAGPADSVREIKLTCADSAGRKSYYTADLTAPETFTMFRRPSADAKALRRSPLTGDPMARSQSDLIAAGYGLRPDAQKDPAAYGRWLASARAQAWSTQSRRTSLVPRPRNDIKTRQSGGWTGSVLKGSPKYVAIEGIFNVPTALPGALGTQTTGISVWTGLGGYGGSGLIQGGVFIESHPHTANYQTFREYCCGDGDSNSRNGVPYAGDFNPVPGDMIFAQNWYCDEKGGPNIAGGFGCTFLHDLTSGQILSCTSANSDKCWSVKALPSCSDSPGTPNCMVLGQTAEFIVENVSPQLDPTSTAFTPVAPTLAMAGSALSSVTNKFSQSVSSDSAIDLLTDFTDTTTHIKVSVASPDQTQFSVGKQAVGAATMIQSSYAAAGKPRNFDALALKGNSLWHYWRDNSLPNTPWKSDAVVSGTATGAGPLIQSSYGLAGRPGNFEALVLEENNLVHYWRDNSTDGTPWKSDAVVSRRATGAATMIQSSYGAAGKPGNFDALVLEGNNLVHYWRDNSAPGTPWKSDAVVSTNATGPATLVQSGYAAAGKPGNFEALVFEGKTLQHYWRDNSAPGTPWHRDDATPH